MKGESPEMTSAVPDDVYDLVGVGIGPFNLALAALAEPTGLRTLFLDGRPRFAWHEGMLIDGTTLQVPFLADLVTLADPTSRWSFLNYLRTRDRLFPFVFAERWHVPRTEYDDYCRWVAESLPSCRFDARVTSCEWDGARRVFVVEHAGGRVLARNVVLGVGTEPVIPAPFADLVGERVFHTAEYRMRRESLCGATDVTVIGSGQSGGEVFLDLLRAQRDTGWRLRWLTRTPAFAPMEYSKLGLEHFTPDYIHYFRGLPDAVRERLIPQQWQLYKGMSAQTIADIYDELYDRRIGGGWADAMMCPGMEVTAAARTADGYALSCKHIQLGETFEVVTDRVLLAAGYAPRRPDFLEPLAALVDWDAQGRYRIDGDYRVTTDPSVTGGLYAQNSDMHTHGVGAPDLTLGAWRAATILNSVAGRPVAPVPATTAFTTFGPPRAGAHPSGGFGRLPSPSARPDSAR